MNEKIVIFPFADPDIKYTMMDNYLFDHIMPDVKPNAWKVLCLVVRKTTGWHKKKDQLSYSQIRDGTGISSQSTVQLAIKELIDKSLVIQIEGSTKWDAFSYSLNCQFSVTVSVTESNPTSTETVTPSVTNNVIEPITETVNTKETPLNKVKDKKTSANADYSCAVSLLSEKEVKVLKLPLSEWQQYLGDEQAERKRSGVIKFLENKITTGPLLPDTEAAHTLFDKLAVEAEAKGRRPPQKFPTLAVKEKFGIAASDLNGTLEAAIIKALESGITSIPRIVNYISSPKWRDSNGQTNTQASRNRQPEANEQAPGETRADAYLRRNQANIDAWEEKMFG